MVSLQSFTVSRNVDATDDHGRKVKIALATIMHDNGASQTIAVPEEKIRFFGEDIIAQEVALALMSPQKPQLDFDPTKAVPKI